MSRLKICNTRSIVAFFQESKLITFYLSMRGLWLFYLIQEHYRCESTSFSTQENKHSRVHSEENTVWKRIDWTSEKFLPLSNELVADTSEQ